MGTTRRLNWNPPTFPQGTIQLYEVVIRNSSNVTILRTITTGDATSLAINLEPGNYNVQVSFFVYYFSFLSFVESAVCMIVFMHECVVWFSGNSLTVLLNVVCMCISTETITIFCGLGGHVHCGSPGDFQVATVGGY